MLDIWLILLRDKRKVKYIIHTSSLCHASTASNHPKEMVELEIVLDRRYMMQDKPVLGTHKDLCNIAPPPFSKRHLQFIVLRF